MHIPEKILKMQKVLHQLSNFEKILDLELEKLENKIVALNKEQIKFGYRADGSDITPYYTNYTIAVKGQKGTLTNNEPFIVNLYDTGSFVAGFYILITPNEIIIDSSDNKTSELTGKYGAKIFGLNSQNLKIAIDDLRSNILKYVRAQLNNI